MKKILELGPGKNPYVPLKNEKVIRVDKVKFPWVDVVYDLNKFPWPFRNNEFDIILAFHVLEHLKNLERTMEEIWRILKPKGIIKIRVPYFASPNAFSDPTHHHFFTLKTFDYWDPSTSSGGALGHEVIGAKFKIIKKKLLFPRIFKFVSWVAKKNPNFYEFYLSRLFPAYDIYIEMKKI